MKTVKTTTKKNNASAVEATLWAISVSVMVIIVHIFNNF